MEREVGGGIGMGNTCKPMAVSFQYMTKSTTNKKEKKGIKKKKKINIHFSEHTLCVWDCDRCWGDSRKQQNITLIGKNRDRGTYQVNQLMWQ